MTITIREEEINNYYLEITQNKYSESYTVRLLHKIGGLYYPQKENIYPTLKKANNRFAALKREINR